MFVRAMLVIRLLPKQGAFEFQDRFPHAFALTYARAKAEKEKTGRKTLLSAEQELPDKSVGKNPIMFSNREIRFPTTF
jgi:hypothetical protein